MHHRSLFFIKPEAIPHQVEIIKRIERTGLTFGGMREMFASEAFVRFFYGHLKEPKPEVYQKLERQFVGKPILMGVVIGENAIELLKQVCGEKTVPAENPPGTIRRDFGGNDPQNIHFNAIHRPTTPEEAEKQIRYYLELL